MNGVVVLQLVDVLVTALTVGVTLGTPTTDFGFVAIGSVYHVL